LFRNAVHGNPSKSKKNLKFWCLYFNCLEYRPEGIESIPNLLSYVGVNLHRFGLRAILEFEIWRQYGGYYSLIYGHFEIRLMAKKCPVTCRAELIWTSMTLISMHSIINQPVVIRKSIRNHWMYHDACPYHTHIRWVQEIRALLITAKYAKFRAEVLLSSDV
jgi:hypothetical protein